MTETSTLVLAWAAGVVLGAVFFGGLWWTVRKGVSSEHPALWFLGSLLLRTALALSGFYVVAGSRWERMLSCLLGFVMAKLAVTWVTRTPKGARSRPEPEATDAP